LNSVAVLKDELLDYRCVQFWIMAKWRI